MEAAWGVCIEVDLIDERFLSLAYPHDSILSTLLDKLFYIFYPLQTESGAFYYLCINEYRVFLPLSPLMRILRLCSRFPSPLSPCSF